MRWLRRKLWYPIMRLNCWVNDHGGKSAFPTTTVCCVCSRWVPQNATTSYDGPVVQFTDAGTLPQDG